MCFKIGHEHWTLCAKGHVCVFVHLERHLRETNYLLVRQLVARQKKTAEEKNNIRKPYGFRVMKLMDS